MNGGRQPGPLARWGGLPLGPPASGRRRGDRNLGRYSIGLLVQDDALLLLGWTAVAEDGKGHTDTKRTGGMWSPFSGTLSATAAVGSSASWILNS